MEGEPGLSEADVRVEKEIHHHLLKWKVSLGHQSSSFACADLRPKHFFSKSAGGDGAGTGEEMAVTKGLKKSVVSGLFSCVFNVED